LNVSTMEIASDASSGRCLYRNSSIEHEKPHIFR